MEQPVVRPLMPADRQWVTGRIVGSWGAEYVVIHEKIYYPAELPGFVAQAGSEIAGLLTYLIEGAACEVVTLDSWCEGRGVGTALIEAVKISARKAGCQRLWLITTNDNTHALRFYQKRGFTLADIHFNAVAKARLLKPEIPLTGADGIPIRDELELEMALKPLSTYKADEADEFDH